MIGLYRLPRTGDFIDLSCVRQIRADPGSKGTSPYVELSGSSVDAIIPCDSYQEAMEIRDKIAAECSVVAQAAGRLR